MRLIPNTRGGALGRFLVGALLVVAFTATTTAVAGLLQFKQVAHYFNATAAIKTNRITLAQAGAPQTLLLVGSDHRAGEPFRLANTDTMLLMRIDPNSSTINLLSLPRDLKVHVPDKGTFKLNAAYSLGGTDLLLRTIQADVFPELHVNHIIDVNFSAFSQLIDAIGCVYTDVDHRYFNNTAVDNYSSIDIQPGYQKLCGDNQSDSGALAFVRFRHLDSDIVRNARQQDFLRWAKDGYSAGSLLANKDTLLRIFGHNTQTDADLHSSDGVENLFNLIAFSAGHTIKTIPFPAILPNCGPGQPGPHGQISQTPCYVLGDPAAEAEAFRRFMAVTHPAPAKPAPATAHAHAPSHSSHVSGLTDDLSDGQSQAAALGNVGMALYAPAKILAGSQYCTPGNLRCPVEEGQAPAQIGIKSGYPRAYLIRDESGHPHLAYRMTLVINPLLGQYYGVQGMTWQSPPILNNPMETRVVDGKHLQLFYNGHKLSLVAWHTPKAVYWVSNTLTDGIGNSQLLAIAASLAPVS